MLSLLGPKVARFRTSLYDDDAALSINPIKDEIAAVRATLELFWQVSGLVSTSPNVWLMVNDA